MFFDEDFDGFINDFGTPVSIKPIDEAVIEKYSSKLPGQIFKYWRALGACKFGDGLMWMTNPDDYADLLDDWLSDTAFADRKDLSVIARTAFGELFAWAKDRGCILKINPNLSVIYYFKKEDEVQSRGDYLDELMRFFWGAKSPKRIDLKDDAENPLFERLVKKYGVLNDEEMYGFKHRLNLGGTEDLNNMDIMKLEVYHDIAMQMEPPRVLVL